MHDHRLRASSLEIVAALAVALTSVGCDAEPAADASAQLSAPILGGATSTADPAVAALVARPQTCGGPRPSAFCSGTLVAPRVVLTAAHCLENLRAVDVRLFFGRDVGDAGAFVDVVGARVHPSYDASSGAFDVALLLLATPAPTAPVPISSPGVDASLVGRDVRLVGFGVDESMATGAKRTGTARVSKLDAETFTYVPDPAMTCDGDSGGPVFYDDGSGERLVGVTRSGDAGCTQFGTALRVDGFASDFVAPFVAAAASAPTPTVADPNRDYCASTCRDDADCPTSMACLSDRHGATRCGLPSSSVGRFGGACGAETDCGAGVCAWVADGDCRCFEPCGVTPPTAPMLAGGGGCATAPGVEGWPATIVLAGLLVVLRRVRELNARFRN